MILFWGNYKRETYFAAQFGWVWITGPFIDGGAAPVTPGQVSGLSGLSGMSAMTGGGDLLQQ